MSVYNWKQFCSSYQYPKHKHKKSFFVYFKAWLKSQYKTLNEPQMVGWWGFLFLSVLLDGKESFSVLYDGTQQCKASQIIHNIDIDMPRVCNAALSSTQVSSVVTHKASSSSVILTAREC